MYVDAQALGIPEWTEADYPHSGRRDPAPSPYSPEFLQLHAQWRKQFKLQEAEDQKKRAEVEFFNQYQKDTEAVRKSELLSRKSALVRIQARNIDKIRSKMSTIPPEYLQRELPQAKKQNYVAISRLLSLRKTESPFTLVVDDLNQSARPLMQEFVHRNLPAGVKIIVLAFESKVVNGNTHIIRPAGLTVPELFKKIDDAIDPKAQNLILIDSMHDLLENANVNMTLFLSQVMKHPGTYIVGVYHNDVPVTSTADQTYEPVPLTMLKYIASTVITCRSLKHVIAAKAAKERSLPEPAMGLLEEAEGVIQSMGADSDGGVVLDCEFRRKSGTTTKESFFLRRCRLDDFYPNGVPHGKLKQEYIELLEQNAAYKAGIPQPGSEDPASTDEPSSTFDLGLTDKQRRDREGVVLPYHDAQKGEGGEGGRILYQMDREDDFDEEEDEM